MCLRNAVSLALSFAIQILIVSDAFAWSLQRVLHGIEVTNENETDVYLTFGTVEKNSCNGDDLISHKSYGWTTLPPGGSITDAEKLEDRVIPLPWEPWTDDDPDLECSSIKTWIYAEQFVDDVLVRYWNSKDFDDHFCVTTDANHAPAEQNRSEWHQDAPVLEEQLPRMSYCLGNDIEKGSNVGYQYFSGIPLEKVESVEDALIIEDYPLYTGNYRYRFNKNEQSIETLVFENDEQVSSGGEALKINYFIKEFDEVEDSDEEGNINEKMRAVWNAYEIDIQPGEIVRPKNHDQLGRFWSRSVPVVDEIYISATSESYRYGDQIYCISRDRSDIRKPIDRCVETETPMRAYKKLLLRNGGSNTFVFSHQPGFRTAGNDDEMALMKERKLTPEKRVVLDFTNNTGEEVHVFYFIEPREYNFKGKTLAKGWFTIGKDPASRREVAVFDKLSAYYGDIYIYARSKTMRWGSEMHGKHHCAPVNSPIESYAQDIFDPICPNFNQMIGAEMAPVGTFVIKNAKSAYAGQNDSMGGDKNRKYSITFKKDYAEVQDGERKEIPTVFDTRVELCNDTREPLQGSILFPEKDGSWTSVNMSLPAAETSGDQCMLYEEPILSLPDDPYAGYIAVYAKGLQSGRTWSGMSPEFCMAATHRGEIPHALAPESCDTQTRARGRMRWTTNDNKHGIHRIVFSYDNEGGNEKLDPTFLEVCNNSTRDLKYAFAFETEENKELRVKGWVEIKAGTCVPVEVPIEDTDYTGNVFVYAKDENENEFNRTEQAACVGPDDGEFEDRIPIVEGSTCPPGWDRVYMEEKEADIGQKTTIELGVIPDPEIFVCNDHDEPLYVSYALFSKDLGKWQSHSWIRVEPPSDPELNQLHTCEYSELRDQENCQSITMHLENQGLYHGALFLYAETDFYKLSGGQKEMCVAPLHTTEDKVFLDAERECKKTVNMSYYSPFAHGEKRQYRFKRDEEFPTQFSSDDCNPEECTDQVHQRPAYNADRVQQCICERGYKEYGKTGCVEKVPCRISTRTKDGPLERETVERKFYDTHRRLVFHATGTTNSKGEVTWREYVEHSYPGTADDDKPSAAREDVDGADGTEGTDPNKKIADIRNSSELERTKMILYDAVGKPTKETMTYADGSEDVTRYDYDAMNNLWKVVVNYYNDEWCDEITLIQNHGGVPLAEYLGDDYSCQDIDEAFSKSTFAGSQLRKFVQQGYFKRVEYYTYDSEGRLDFKEVQTNGNGLTDGIVDYTYVDKPDKYELEVVTRINNQVVESRVKYIYDPVTRKSTSVEYFHGDESTPYRWIVHKYDSYGYNVETIYLNRNRFATEWKNRDFDCW